MANLNDLMGGGSEDQNILSLDDITGSFKTKTQRQEYYQPEEEEEISDLDASLIDPDNETTPSDFTGVWSPDEDGETRAVSPERAHRTGERIARVIDTGFSFVVSNFIAKDSGKDYKADEKDLHDIAEAWGDMAEDKQWEFSPGWQLVILYAIVYGPLTKEAFNDRRMMEIEDRQNALEEKIRQQQYELDRIREQEAAEARRKADAEARRQQFQAAEKAKAGRDARGLQDGVRRETGNGKDDSAA